MGTKFTRRQRLFNGPAVTKLYQVLQYQKVHSTPRLKVNHIEQVMPTFFLPLPCTMKHIIAWSWQHDSNGLPPIRGPNDLNRYFLLELDWTMLYWASCWNFTMFVNFSLSHRSIPFLSTKWIPIIGFLYRNLPQNQCLPTAQVWCSCGTFPCATPW